MASDRGAKKAIGQLALKTARGFLSSFARMGLLGKMGAVLGLCVVVINLLLAPMYGVSINAAIGLIFGLSLLAASLSYPIASFSQKLLIKSAFIAAALFLFFICCLIVSEGVKNTANFSEDAVIILGSGIRGEEPSIMLSKRLESALEYIAKNPTALIIATGGQGYGEDISEAEAIKRYLITNGVNGERIVLEDRSGNTYENFVNSKRILDAFFSDRDYAVAVVTSDFHMYRALQTAKRCAITAKSYNAPLDWYLRAASFLRETLSIVKFALT